MQRPKRRFLVVSTPYFKALQTHINILNINENSGTQPWNTQVIPVSYALDGECE